VLTTIDMFTRVDNNWYFHPCWQQLICSPVLTTIGIFTRVDNNWYFHSCWQQLVFSPVLTTIDIFTRGNVVVANNTVVNTQCIIIYFTEQIQRSYI